MEKGILYITNDRQGWEMFYKDVKLFPKMPVLFFFDNELIKQKII